MGYQVAVYAIAKNEEKFAARWARSMAEADFVIVLDTGSEDDTVKILKENGVTVFTEKIEPWRFDKARNRSLFFVPRTAEICVCTDLDEVFEEGWREKLEGAWTNDTTRARYRYVWKYDEEGGEEVVFLADKIHARKGYRWRFPVHEVLESAGEERYVTAPLLLKHFPDPAKSRAQYLPLLELAVKEEKDARNVHYLGREYLFQGRYECAISALQAHLALPDATWEAERASSMRFLARAHLALGREREAERWFLRAVAEAPEQREILLDYALFLYDRGNWAGVYDFTARALSITQRPLTYLSEGRAWDGTLSDLNALAAFRLGRFEEARAREEEAARLSPSDARIAGNLAFYRAECARRPSLNF